MKKLTSPFTLIKKSFDIFTTKENLKFFVQIYIPLGVLSFLSLLFTYVPFMSAFFNTSTGGVVSGIFNILFLLVTVYVDLAGITAVMQIIDGGKLDMGDIYKKSYSNFGKFILLTIILFLINIAGIILLIVPFILVVTWFAFSKFIYVESNQGIKFSLSESKKLVKGKFWKVFWRVVVFGGFSVLAQVILSILPYGTGVVVFNLCGALFILPSLLLFKELAAERNLNE